MLMTGVMRGTQGRSRPVVVSALLSLVLAGCSTATGLFGKSDPDAKHETGLANMFGKDEPKVRAVEAADLVGPDGQCAGQAAPSAVMNFRAGPDASPPGSPSSVPPAPATPQAARGIGLEMTECEVVRAAGHTDQVEISTGEHGERRVVLTYVQGERPGIYRFEDGRLKSIERVPGPEAPAKPAKSGRAGKQGASD